MMERYERHLGLEKFGPQAQTKLRNGSALVVGLGGLGSPAALYLVAAGIGRLGLMDDDVVSLSNLQRQILHATDNLGEKKTASAERKLKALNPDVQLEVLAERLTPENASAVISNYDFILICTDNLASKYLANDVCIQLGKPFSIAGVTAWQGQTMTHVKRSACYRCLFPEPDKTAVEDKSVFGPLVGIVGSVQAAECVKYLTETGELLTDRLLTVDAQTLQFQCLEVKPSENCPACSIAPWFTDLLAEAY